LNANLNSKTNWF